MFDREPDGFTLVKADGARANRIRGDLIPGDTLVIAEGGRHFVRTGDKDESGFLIYAEGYKTHEYRSHGAA